MRLVRVREMSGDFSAGSGTEVVRHPIKLGSGLMPRLCLSSPWRACALRQAAAKGQENRVSGPPRANYTLSVRNLLSFQSLPQALCLVAPSPVAFSAPEHKAKHGKRGDRDECDNPTHLRPPDACVSG